MLSSGSKYAEECFAGNFIGGDYGIKQDLTKDPSEDLKDFNHNFIPIYQVENPR